MALDDDELNPRVKKKPVHEIGQELATLSIEELAERIEGLKAEIARLEAAVERKRASRSSADQFFKR
jgi:uncharacterized small protein (DUF1192 family)